MISEKFNKTITAMSLSTAILISGTAAAIADGHVYADFTTAMGMLVDKRHLGFGARSWRYSMIVNDGIIEKMFVEDFSDDEDPFQVSSAPSMLEAIQNN